MKPDPDEKAGVLERLRVGIREAKRALFGPSVVTMRLEGELHAAVIELAVTEELYRSGDRSGEPEDTERSSELESWNAAAIEAFGLAKRELYEGHPGVGWIYYFTAKRMELVALGRVSRESFPARATILHREAAEVLDPWELAAVEDLLCEGSEVDEDVTLAEIYEASKVLQDHYVDRYFRIETFRKQMWQFTVLGFLTTVAIVAYVLLAGPLFSGTNTATSDGVLIPAVLFGFLGAAVSGLLSLDDASVEMQRRGQPLSQWLSLARTVLGGAAAVALFAFLQSGVLQLGTLSVGLVLAVSFVSGFTERLLMRAVAALVGDEPNVRRT